MSHAVRATKRLNDIPTASGGITRAAYAFAARARVPVGALLERANLTLQQAENARLRIAVKDQIEFLNLVANELDDEFLGIRLAQIVDLRELGLLYYVMASSETVGDALRRASRYSAIINEGVQIGYRAGKFVTVTFDYRGVARQQDRHQIEFFIAILLRMCRQLSGLSSAPSRIEFVHHRAGLPPEIRKLFGANVAFARGADQIIYPGSITRVASINADPYLNALLIKYCEEAVASRRKRATTWQVKVENAVAPLLPHGQAQIGEIASELGVSRRTLARRLAREGLTFRALLDRLRFELARRYLQEPDLPISEIAWLLGYRESSAFSHAFRRWTGGTPKRLQSGGQPVCCA